MAKKEKSEKDSNWASEIETYSRQIWLAGLGAYVKAGKEGYKVFENLVKKGEKEENSVRGAIEKQVKELSETGEETLAEAGAHIDKSKKKLAGNWYELESAFQKRMEGAVSRLGVPTRDEIKTLEAKLDALTEVVGKLAEKIPATTKPKATARKAPAKAKSKPKAAPTARKAPAKAESKPKAADKPATTAKPEAAAASNAETGSD